VNEEKAQGKTAGRSRVKSKPKGRAEAYINLYTRKTSANR